MSQGTYKANRKALSEMVQKLTNVNFFFKVGQDQRSLFFV